MKSCSPCSPHFRVYNHSLEEKQRSSRDDIGCPHERRLMKKVQTKNKLKGLFGLFAAFAMAIGVGVSLAPRSATNVHAASTPATMTAGTNGSAATVNGKDAIKVGTSSTGGDMTITVGTGAVKLSFYAAAWNKVTGLSLNLTGATAGTTTFPLTADSGIAYYSPFTLIGQESSYYFETTLSGITSNTDIKLTTSSAKRFVIWDASYDVGGGEPLESISLDVESLSLDIMDTHQLVPSFEPDGASAGVSYSITASNPTGVISVSAGGLVTGLKTGTATITATTTDGSNLSANVNVTVTSNYSSNILTPAEAQELAVGADVLVRGKVVADIKNNGAYAIQVGDRGIMTYGINGLTIGNDYIIAAKMAAYQGMPQISNATSVVDMGPSTTTVTPKVINDVSELNAKLSGTLVQINGMGYESGTFSTSAASNVTLKLGANDLVIRATKDVPSAAIDAANAIFTSTGPDDVLNITTVAGWFNGEQLLFSEETIIQKVVPLFGTLDHIVLNTTNVVTSYYVGETFSLSGLVVTAYDETNLAKIVTEEATSSLADGYTFVEGDIGSKTITISYEEDEVEKTETFTITVAVAPSWRKATLFHPNGGGTSNLAESTNVAEDVGLDEDVFDVRAIKGSASYNVGLNNGGTLRLYFHADGGSILSVSISSGKTIGKLVFNFGGTVAKAKIMVDGVEKYNDTPSANGFVTLENFQATSFSIQNVNSSNTQIHLNSIEIFYEDPIYTEAKGFADWMMHADRDAEECEDKFLEAWLMWDELSSEAQDLFMTHADFDDALARVRMWAVANDVDWDSDVVGDGGSHLQRTTVTNSPEKALQGVLIIGVFGLTTLMGYYFLRKRRVI